MNIIKRNVLPAAFCCALLSGLVSTANAVVYDLFLWDGGAVGAGTPLFVPVNNSSVEVAEAITWGLAGTSGTFDVVGIQVDVSGSVYDLSDAIAPATATWDSGQLVALSYQTADFSLSVTPTYNNKEWSGFLTPSSEVPLPGALVLFASALGLLGSRVSRK
ncbi:hypothetical protein [Oceanicoccus sp. KOV_DT_Chl]|uniref:hypothetical protein n=1 Tax=Oceanicoccus sp. KOV_DT_Chl TaxID=1904639 RepID=UPI000C7A3CCF|nr:hypothetical protein [Oceanicoccus sp. KOV_DT_Chl]